LIHSGKSFTFGAWHDIEIVGIGANIKTYVDGAVTMDYTDPDPLVFGGINYQTYSDGLAYVDDVEVTGPPSPSVSWIKTGGPSRRPLRISARNRSMRGLIRSMSNSRFH
jgi:hypothetical protein